jgi:hypothetical protein
VAGFTFRLQEDGVEIGRFETAVGEWRVGDELYESRRACFYRILEIVDGAEDVDALFVVARVRLGTLD